MKFKLDENFGTRSQWLFRAAGHDVVTVREELLEGATDRRLFNVCKDEKRCLITLDLDFSNVVRFPPHTSAGIAVIRLPQNSNLVVIEKVIKRFLNAIEREPISGQLWIIETDRIRIHQSTNDA